jgi:hypothetical protein
LTVEYLDCIIAFAKASSHFTKRDRVRANPTFLPTAHTQYFFERVLHGQLADAKLLKTAGTCFSHVCIFFDSNIELQQLKGVSNQIASGEIELKQRSVCFH